MEGFSEGICKLKSAVCSYEEAFEDKSRIEEQMSTQDGASNIEGDFKEAVKTLSSLSDTIKYIHLEF
jgi:hypothetical protein